MSHLRCYHFLNPSGAPSDYRQTTSDDWVPSVNVRRELPIPLSPKSASNPHGVVVRSRLKRKRLFEDEISTDTDQVRTMDKVNPFVPSSILMP